MFIRDWHESKMQKLTKRRPGSLSFRLHHHLMPLYLPFHSNNKPKLTHMKAESLRRLHTNRIKDGKDRHGLQSLSEHRHLEIQPTQR